VGGADELRRDGLMVHGDALRVDRQGEIEELLPVIDAGRR
jgi:hypothetical protein